MSIDDRLSQVETDILEAAVSGGSALATVLHALSNLLVDADKAVRTTNIDDQAMKSAMSASSRILFFSEQLLDLQITTDVMSSTILSNLEAVFSRVGVDDMAKNSSTVSHFQPLPPTSQTPGPYSYDIHVQDKSGIPRYIEPAYTWLIKNLHNPYPSKETVQSVARTTGSNPKAVDAWFIDARKRIGWNTLRKQHFSNKRAGIVDAATRFFLPRDEKRPVDVNIELEFAAIEKRAKDLYSDKFTESALALKLSTSVKDFTPEMKAQAKEDEKRRREQEERVISQLEQDVLAASSYPSPVHSPGRTPEPLPSSPLLSASDLSIQPIAGQKRRSTSDEDDSPSLDRPNKRTRLDTPSVPSIGLPSPTPSHQDVIENVEENTVSSTSSPTEPFPVASTSSNKRRFSEGDSQGAAKRPRNLPVGVRTVSDPLPVPSVLFEASSMDDWFEDNFGITNSIPVGDLALDVEVFNYTDLGLATQTAPVSGDELETSLLSELLDETIPPFVVDEGPSSKNDLVISTKDVDYEDLFSDYGEIAPAETCVEIPQDVLQFPLVDVTSEASSLGVGQQTTTDMELFTSNTNLQDFVSAVEDSWQAVLPLGCSTMFNTSLIGINSLDSSLDSILLRANKAAKQKMLEGMKEVTRRLEEVIAGSP